MLTNGYFSRLAPLAAIAIVACAPFHFDEVAWAQAAAKYPCAADSSYQRLAFWVGDWDVVDSTGARYAAQRVHSAVDACAVTAEWTGLGGSRGLGVSAYDAKLGAWKQVYVTNQVPSPAGVFVRKSDASYKGPGVRFIPMIDPAPGELAVSRVTIMPFGDHGAMQLFEDSRDGGKTWRTVFKAEHRRP